MTNLKQHYSLLLGLDKDWTIENVELKLEENAVKIALKHVAKKVVCPDCGEKCSIADHAPQRIWRHLDTMQFETILTAKTPRSRCKKCGVKTIKIPWADKSGRFTLMFEAFAIEVLLACGNVKSASELLNLNWHATQEIMHKGVERGLERRGLDDIKYAGVDEKSFRKRHKYVSVLTDISGSRVLEVVEGRKEENADKLWKVLSAEQLGNIEAVSMDMWSAFINSTKKAVPDADIVHDKFHVSKYLNDAVNKVRQAEHKEFKEIYEVSPLQNTRQVWLTNPKNFREEQKIVFKEAKEHAMLTSRAWAIKDSFSSFWEYVYPGNALKFFNGWYGWARRSRLEPMKKVALMIKKHLDNLLTYCRHRITNAASEGFNSVIQSVKTNARGFKAFANYRLRILFYCGKLDMQPEI